MLSLGWVLFDFPRSDANKMLKFVMSYNIKCKLLGRYFVHLRRKQEKHLMLCYNTSVLYDSSVTLFLVGLFCSLRWLGGFVLHLSLVSSLI